MQQGVKATEDANRIKADKTETITLIRGTKYKYNHFNVTIEPFNSKENTKWHC
jgi:hypothetical protein